MWYKNRQPVTNKPTKNNKLYLSSSEDAGNYSCAVRGLEEVRSPDQMVTISEGGNTTAILVGVTVFLVLIIIAGALWKWCKCAKSNAKDTGPQNEQVDIHYSSIRFPQSSRGKISRDTVELECVQYAEWVRICQLIWKLGSERRVSHGYIQACRALMITSIVLGMFGLIFTLVGMQCSKIGGENYIVKGRIAVLGGVFFILQGVCTMIAVSWYASNITQQFFNPLYTGIKFEIGDGLYIGWCSATLALISGFCLLCVCGNDSKEERM
ncbi:claudin 15 precursor [Silurus meridionalis]|nr:claudin 15 precursor [Silurus meridionalis]